MPWTYAEPETIVERRGVIINHVYPDDISDNKPLDYWYEIACREFDIRELGIATPDELHNLSAHPALLCKAIDLGLLVEEDLSF